MTEKEKIKEEYDQIHKKSWEKRIQRFGAAEKVIFNRLQTSWSRLALKLLSNHVIEDKQVLEVGCGYGALSIELAQLGARVIGLDISGVTVKIAKRISKKLNTRIEAIQGDATNIPCDSNTFYLVVSCETLEHIPNFTKALAEMKRCAKPRGYLLLTIPNVLNPAGLYQRIATKQPFERSLTLASMTREIRKSGNLKIINIEATYSFDFLESILKSDFLESVGKNLPKSLGSHIGFLIQKTLN